MTTESNEIQYEDLTPRQLAAIAAMADGEAEAARRIAAGDLGLPMTTAEARASLDKLRRLGERSDY